jgi:sirohydrochlorin cobaltochelatase
MNDQQALVLFAHGARDPRWAQPFLKMQAIAQQQLPGAQVELAFLELMEPRLPEVVDRLAAAGHQRVAVVPVFLGQGGHVLRDLPPMIDELRARHPQLQLTVSDAVGESPDVLAAIASYCVGSLQRAS